MTKLIARPAGDASGRVLLGFLRAIYASDVTAALTGSAASINGAASYGPCLRWRGTGASPAAPLTMAPFQACSDGVSHRPMIRGRGDRHFWIG